MFRISISNRQSTTIPSSSAKHSQSPNWEWAVPLLSLLLTCGACGHSDAISEETPAAPAPVSVEVVKAEVTTLRPRIDLHGHIVEIPERTATVSPLIGGWIQKVVVVDGQSVQAGDELIRLDSRTAEIDIAKAKAAVAEKEAALARLKRGHLPQERAIAKQDRDKAQVTLDALRTQFAEIEKLHKRKEISTVQYENMKSTLQSAEETLATAESHLALSEEGNPPEIIAEAEALFNAAKASLDTATLAREACSMSTPIGGVLTHLAARQGTFVERSTPLATIVDLSRLFVQLRVPSAYFAKVQPPARVDVTITSLPGEVFQGKVSRISGQADPLTGDVDAFVEVENPQELLRPGLSCQAVVWLPEIAQALTIPVAAIADRAGTSVVTVVRSDKAYEVEVKLGIEAEGTVQVISGLSAGDVVVTQGGYALPEGCLVRPNPPNKMADKRAVP